MPLFRMTYTYKDKQMGCTFSQPTASLASEFAEAWCKGFAQLHTVAPVCRTPDHVRKAAARAKRWEGKCPTIWISQYFQEDGRQCGECPALNKWYENHGPGLQELLSECMVLEVGDPQECPAYLNYLEEENGERI